MGQEVPSQTQAPWTQCWPVPHAGPVPQVHVPLLAQVSVVPLQVLHVLPATPQVVSVCDSHTPLALQHPPGHEVALHWQVPDTHCCPWAHCGPPPQVQPPPVQPSATVRLQAWHAAPTGAHSVLLVVVHVVPLQHPSGHDVALQAHWPPTHS